MVGKGSRQRPVDRDKFASNWDRIFSKPQQPESKPQPASVPVKSGKGSQYDETQ